MKGKKPIKQSSVNALSKAYKQAFKAMTELEKQGYQFDKRTKQVMSAETFQKKALNPTKRDIERYKSLTKKTTLYKRSTGFYDVDNNRMLTVSQGKIYLRRQKAKQKKESQEPVSKYTELYQVLDNITTEKDTHGRVWSVADDKRDVMSAYDDFVSRGGQVTDDLIRKCQNYVDIINIDSNQDHVYQAFNSVIALLNGGTSVGDGGEMELIGTPYES